MTSDCLWVILLRAELWGCRAPPVDQFLKYISFMKFADIHNFESKAYSILDMHGQHI